MLAVSGERELAVNQGDWLPFILDMRLSEGDLHATGLSLYQCLTRQFNLIGSLKGFQPSHAAESARGVSVFTG